MPKPIRVAIIGAGEWAQLYHLPALKAIKSEIPLEIVGIWNRSPERTDQAARKFGIGRVYTGLDEAANDGQADCHVVLVNSTALFDIVSRLLPRRLPIFTEKPPGASYLEARKLAELTDIPNTVAFNRRYMPINRRFKQLAGDVEGAYFAECHFYRNERFYDHFILETGVHGINFMEYICGPIRTVRTEKRKTPRNGTSFWICQLTFESGMRGIMKFFPSSGSSIERYELHGDGESIYLNCPQTYTSDHPGQIFVHKDGKLISTIADEESDHLVTAGFMDEYRDFFRAVREGSDTLSNFRNASNTMRVAEAIEAAAGDGEEIVLHPGEGLGSKLA